MRQLKSLGVDVSDVVPNMIRISKIALLSHGPLMIEVAARTTPDPNLTKHQKKGQLSKIDNLGCHNATVA